MVLYPHIFVALASLLVLSRACVLEPTKFRTNNLQNPLAIADDKPRFSYALSLSEDTAPSTSDHYQTAYRILCVDALTGEHLWDSGKVLSPQTLQIDYGGKPLKSLQIVQWKVQVWDENGDFCADSPDTPVFETGLLDEDAWQDAEWIARYGKLPSNVSLCSMMAETDENQVPRFRAVLRDIPHDVIQVRAYIVGLGYYQLYIDGEKIGDALLDPGWTTYSQRVLYAAHDVTSRVTEGSLHTIGVEVGNGWWNPLPLGHNGHLNIRQHLVAEQGISSSRPMFRLNIFGFKKDGTAVSLLKTSSEPRSEWRTAGSPTIFNNLYLGEKYDARLERIYEGWATPAYFNNYCTANACQNIWKPPVKADISGLGRVEAQELPPIRRQKMLESSLLSTRLTQNGTLVGIIDTSVNHAGSCRIRVSHSNSVSFGSSIHIKYGELLTKDGDLNVMTSVVGQIKNRVPEVPCEPAVAYQQDTLVLGNNSVDWTPTWSWHGFRYIEVQLPAGLTFDGFTMECFTMRSDVDVIANFSSSDPWLSELRQLVRNTFESNMMSIQSDCPHRERFGYGGDALGSGEAGMSIYDLSAFYRKRILDFNDAMRISEDSDNLTGFTETSPFVGIQTAGLGPGTGPIGWETFQPEGQLWLYKYYGDTRTMHDSLRHTEAYVRLLDSDPQGIENGLGDWMPTHGTDVAFTGRGFQRMSYLAFANITEILGLPLDISTHYRNKAAYLANMINQRFMRDGDSGAYIVGTDGRSGNVTQTGQGMALFNGFIVDTSIKEKALLRLVDDAKAASFLSGACRSREKSTPESECKNAEGGPGPHMTAGLFGIKWVLMALADGGFNDLAYELVTTKTYPGLRWMMNNSFANATTIWESFFFSDNTFSHNHPMFGSTEVWLIQSVAGLQPHPSSHGLNHMLIKPKPPTQLQYATASFESPRGTYAVSWKLGTSGTMELNVTVPPNCRATVYFPASKKHQIVHLTGSEEAQWSPFLAFEVGSGYHKFKSLLTTETE